MTAYKVYALPSEDGDRVDIVVANPEADVNPCYVHYSFAASATINKEDLQGKRSITLGSFRDWKVYSSKHPEIVQRLQQGIEYVPGSLVLDAGRVNHISQVGTALRLGSLELLANILSGRITAGDKDPFPHQLSLLQHVTSRSRKGTRVLIADEVGLGKTIEAGLVLRDIFLERGRLDQFSCLYLTSGGLREDVKEKLQTIFPGDTEEQNIVQTIPSFKAYGVQPIFGIHVGSMHAARRYVTDKAKETLKSRVAPGILIIDECHHCASDADLHSEADVLSKQTTETYKAAYQLISGTYWSDSTPPSLIIFMSATPFRSRNQFINLLKLLSHDPEKPQHSFAPGIDEASLIHQFKEESSPATIVWRQQEEVRSWRGERLFPNLDVSTDVLDTSEDYLELIRKIVKTVRRIHKQHGKSYGGFAIRQLEMRLTSSSVAAACWIFRWCVAHKKWNNKDEFKKDDSRGTLLLRKLIVLISQRLCTINPKADALHSDVSFPGDGHTFTAKSISQGGSIPEIYDYSKGLGQSEEDEELFTVAESDIADLIGLAIDLMDLSHDQGRIGGVENAKLKWLNDKLEQNPGSRFLVFTESLQTCEIVQRALSGRCEMLTGQMGAHDRERAVQRFRNPGSDVRVLVATSAADEGFDFQVADHVIHWDLSPSPAILMQRNGRVARLGQVVDVKAHYLVMAGTHEERRVQALQERFTSLGITDEKLRLKILGSLTKDEEERIETAVQENDIKIIGSILESAKAENDDMEARLRKLHLELRESWVIDRNSLQERLKNWALLARRHFQKDQVQLLIKEVTWSRPVFAERATKEEATADVAIIKWFDRNQRYVFDPEYKLFGNGSKGLKLAGLVPWRLTSKKSETKIRPAPFDLIGQLAQRLARLPEADFARLPRIALAESDNWLQEALFLLFASHPLRELESDEAARRYLTFYAFRSGDSDPINPQGADAESVHRLISLLEDQRPPEIFTELDRELALQCAVASQQWLTRTRKLGGGFLDSGFFLPIPIALVTLV